MHSGGFDAEYGGEEVDPATKDLACYKWRLTKPESKCLKGSSLELKVDYIAGCQMILAPVWDEHFLGINLGISVYSIA